MGVANCGLGVVGIAIVLRSDDCVSAPNRDLTGSGGPKRVTGTMWVYQRVEVIRGISIFCPMTVIDMSMLSILARMLGTRSHRS